MRDSVRRFFVPTIALTFAAALLLGTSPRASAGTIAFAGFESTGDTWLGVSISGVGTISEDPGAAQFPASGRIYEGARSFQSTNGVSTINFDAVDVSAGEEGVGE